MDSDPLAPLWAAAAEASRLDVVAIRERITAPGWSRVERFDWRYYVPDEVRSAWAAMGDDARLVAFLFAVGAADRDGMADDLRD